eukprot:CAMPEP_0184527910 /NCGR_PEP_ID=MMETSP0198_2-20121128/11491_1 /TAXON_ID=1112570 /ORGANISM="Thraustochytrium sp., Strain LLF1b" /LENGTH=497 /DNA_ID=CAMNT_0026919683 /DNA_START=96 /DNA_END=1589 /DNA_ORIENTATION=+
MGKGQKKDKSSYAEKKAAFWRAILSEKQSDVRNGLINTGLEAQTRNEDGLTSIMFAAINGKPKSLDTLVDYYERRRELRRKGWIDLVDDNRRTALMMAAASGNVKIVDSLLLKGAATHLKDEDGKTARDHAVARKKTQVVEAIDEWLRESEDELEDEDGNVINDGLTSTQRSKIKKKQLEAQERRGATAKKNSKAEAEEASDIESDEPGPPPIWSEVANIVESVKMLRPIQELTVIRDEPEPNVPGNVDPAAFYRTNVNRFELRLAPGVLTTLPSDISRMRRLLHLILNENALTELPAAIGSLRHLKVLEANRNQLTSLPEELSKCSKLEVLDVSVNKISDLSPLDGLTALKTLNVSTNQLTELELDFENVTGLHDLFASNNQIAELPSEIGLVAGLTDLVLENNKIVELPTELADLKKIKELKLDGNPIKDSKVRKYLDTGARKDLWKYLQKSGGKGKKGKKSKKAKAAKIVEEEDDEDDKGFESDDSFDITMEEL